MRFSANLGFLWSDLPLPEAIRAAHAAGFDAVECHWPYDTPPGKVAAALAETGLPMLGLNTPRGRSGDFGLAALPGREDEARQGIDAAIAYARAIGCGAVHVMAGVADGPAAEAAFLANLDHACRAAPDLLLQIEPLNPRDVPGYFLSHADHAAQIIARLGHGNLRLMFDCYHLQILHGDPVPQLDRHAAILGHVQPAGRTHLRGYARDIGLAFQIADDLIDHEGDAALAGKAVGKDAEAGKETFVSLLGPDRAREQARMLVDQAVGHLAQHGAEADLLRSVARFIVERDR